MTGFSQALGGCGSAGYDSTNKIPNSLLLAGVSDEVDAALNSGNCKLALSQVSPIYNSTYTNNSVRLATAASYGCFAKVDVFQNLHDLSKAQNLGGSGFWQFLSKEFASVASPDDKIPSSAGLGIDAVLSAVQDGTTFVSSLEVNASSNNPGSLVFSDRISDANTYLTFLSMSLMGSLLSRDGQPDASTHVKTVNLPWSTVQTVVGDGCEFAAGLLNFYDGLDSIIKASPSSVQGSFSTILNFLNTSLNAACVTGCTVLCGNAVGCSSCPQTLRDRNSCTGVVTDVNSCAAAGIAVFVNSSWI